MVPSGRISTYPEALETIFIPLGTMINEVPNRSVVPAAAAKKPEVPTDRTTAALLPGAKLIEPVKVGDNFSKKMLPPKIEKTLAQHKRRSVMELGAAASHDKSQHPGTTCCE